MSDDATGVVEYRWISPLLTNPRHLATMKYYWSVIRALKSFLSSLSLKSIKICQERNIKIYEKGKIGKWQREMGWEAFDRSL